MIPRDLSGLANVGNPYTTPGQHPGMIQPGNLDLGRRNVVHNPDGSISTVKSVSFNQDGRETLVPEAYGGAVHSALEALHHYLQTGQNLGRFTGPAAADSYAEDLHRQQMARYLGGHGAG